MKKFHRLGLLCLLLSVFLNNETINAQQIILINGEPTQVTLNGDQIQSIVSTQLKNYMDAYKQDVDDEFIKSLVSIEISQKPERAASTANTTNKTRNSITVATETDVALVENPHREK